MGYFLTTVGAFCIGMILTGGTIYWYQKEFTYSYRKFIGMFHRLLEHKDEILTTVEQRRWWETLFSDLSRSGEEMDTAARKFNL